MNYTEWMDNIKRKASLVVSRMTEEEKLESMTPSFPAIERLGIPSLGIGTEAANGIQARHDQAFDRGEPVLTTILPGTIGMSSSWDRGLMKKAGLIVGTEMRALYNEGKSNSLTVWAPTVDMERDPRWGRNEESYGEDPYLTSELAGSYVEGIHGDAGQDYLLAAVTAKHFYCNNTEDGRSWKSSDITEKLKWEYYLEVYRRLIVNHHLDSLMASYNAVNGVPNIANPDIQHILKDKWHLQMILSDGSGVMTAINPEFGYKDYTDVVSAALPAGMDIFTDNGEKVKEGLERALSEKRITWEEIDRALVNHFSMFLRTGKVDVDENGNCGEVSTVYDGLGMKDINTEESRKTVKRLTEETAVLLKNEDQALPLKKGSGAVLAGPLMDLHATGWYSGVTDRMVTLKDALSPCTEFSSDLMPVVRIRLDRDTYIGLGEETEMKLIGNRNPGNISYKIRPVKKEEAALFKMMLWDDGKITFRSVKGNRLLTVDHSMDNSQFINEDEEKRLYVAKDEAFGWYVKEVFYLGDDGGKPLSFTDSNVSRFWEDPRGKQLLTWDERPVGINEHGNIRVLTENQLSGACDKNKSRDFGIELAEDPLEKVEKYLEKHPETAVLAAFGTHPMVNCKEDRDRKSIAFPPFERDCIRRLSQVSENINLILMTNYPVAVKEENENISVKSILWTATGSEELGNAVKNLICGDASPSGCLSMTWYRSDADLGSIDDYNIEKTGSTYLYAGEKALYHFGYGLSYGKFRILQADLTQDDKKITVKTTVENTGKHAAGAVVQAYVRRESGSGNDFSKSSDVYRLKGFERTDVTEPGRTATVNVEILKDDLRYYDSSLEESVPAKGKFNLELRTGDGGTFKIPFFVK